MNSLGNDPIRNLPLVTEPRNGKKPASTWQIVLTAFGLVAIVAVFLFGINHQRDETAGQQTTATIPTPAAPQGGDTQQGQQQGDQQTQQKQPRSTTGQGGGDDKSSDQKDQPKARGQKAGGQPIDSNGEPAQRQSK
ncbi:MAG TPA: hypothetical protein VFL53_04725 [Pseudolabrys sp.]|nr:hypothetical protein [Pseudolabrys sp.]